MLQFAETVGRFGTSVAGADSSVPQPEQGRDSTVIDTRLRMRRVTHDSIPGSTQIGNRGVSESAVFAWRLRADPCHLPAQQRWKGQVATVRASGNMWGR